MNIVKDGENGWLASGRSEEAYKVRIEELLQMPIDTLQRLSATALQSYSPYSITACVEKYVQLFSAKFKDIW